jgi:hypothetical protein
VLLLSKSSFLTGGFEAAFLVAAGVKANVVCLSYFWLCCQLVFELKEV